MVKTKIFCVRVLMSLQIDERRADIAGSLGIVGASSRKTVMVVFGTRPEAIKLAPVIAALKRRSDFRTVTVFTGQHAELATPALELFGVAHDHNLAVMIPGQPLSVLCGRLLDRLDPLLTRHRPDLLLVQGDTTSAMAGTLAAFHRQIRVAHVEAGLRTHDPADPFPEEANRQIITRLATYHFAATKGNRSNLLREGVLPARIALTGNPVVDALHRTLERTNGGQEVAMVTAGLHNRRLIVLTTHRRESFGARMTANLRALRCHIDRVEDLFCVFPVHPNPSVTAAATEILGDHPRIKLLAPLPYAAFVHLLARAWLIISDSGGIQEEAPTLRRPLIVLRGTTERPEAVECGVARLTGGCSSRLISLLEQAERDTDWFRRVASCRNPFGNGDSGEKIVSALARFEAPGPVLTPLGAA
jgi:UDP-N-acetylglucosamine 2-epimerase